MQGKDEPQLDVFSYVSQEQRMRNLAILATKAKAECGAPGSKENLWPTADVAKPLLQSQNRGAWRESKSCCHFFRSLLDRKNDRNLPDLHLLIASGHWTIA